MKTPLLLLLAATAAFSGVRVTSARPDLRPSHAAKPGTARATFVESDRLHVIPYILDGNNFSTQIVFTNLEDHAVKANCGFYGPDGKDIELTFGTGAGAGLDIDFEAYGSTTATINGGGTRLITAWGYCNSDNYTDRFAVETVIRNVDSTGAVRDFTVPFQPDDETKSTLPIMAPATSPTAIILINTANEQTMKTRLSLIDGDGKVLAAGQVSLDAGQQALVVATTVFRTQIAATNLKQYTVLVENIEGAPWLVSMALRATPNVAFASRTIVRWSPE